MLQCQNITQDTKQIFYSYLFLFFCNPCCDFSCTLSLLFSSLIWFFVIFLPNLVCWKCANNFVPHLKKKTILVDNRPISQNFQINLKNNLMRGGRNINIFVLWQSCVKMAKNWNKKENEYQKKLEQCVFSRYKSFTFSRVY